MYILTKYTTEEAEKAFKDNKNPNNGYVNVFIKNKMGERLQKIKIPVFVETYENDGVVEEAIDIQFKNVKKIIRLQITHCACYCNSETDYWFITTRGEWVKLPTIEEESYELSMKTKNYMFSKGNANQIKLYEYEDKLVQKLENEEPIVVRKGKKHLKTLLWDGKQIIDKEF